MLKIENLTKCYKDKVAVDNLSLKLNDGEIFGFIGPNGAGKTTTVKCILNFIKKNKGNIYIDDKLMDTNSEYLKELIGYVPSEVNLYEELTVIEMIKLSNTFYKKDCMNKALKLIKLLEIDENKKIEQLSFGNLKKVSIVLAFMHNPKLVILDEPTSSLDPLIKEKFFHLLEEEKKHGTTIFFSTHVLSEVNKMCDRVGIIKDGKLIKIDDVKNLMKTDFSIITIESNEYKKLKLPMKDIIIKEEHKNKIKFIYKGDINNLLNIITKIKIDDILIEEPTIEEIFMHYYK